MKKIIKWLAFASIALIIFAIVLLTLGYLLKENKITTTALKTMLVKEQREALKQQKPFQHIDELADNFSAEQRSLLTIVTENTQCRSDKQCVLIYLNPQNQQCFVAINLTGAAILLKISSEQITHIPRADNCQAPPKDSAAYCKNNICTIK